tara:strand:- start:8122 stop:8388 length:267 start_codon:yes stop_codon:yes gene_type:complete
MALQKANQTQSTRQSNANQPDAYLNLVVVDAQGNEHRLSRGVALEISRKLDRSLINAAKSNPEAVFQLKGTVYVVDEEEQQQDIDFGV